jgi:DNA-binding MarR family transcriptional regulator
MKTKQSLDTLVENLLLAQPVLHKRIMKIKPPDIPGIHISRIHFGILVALHHHQSPVTEIANHFLISKPQMTFIMNQMVEAGLVKRTTNRIDRRIKDTTLTPRGEEIFRRCDEYLKSNIKKMFAGLTEQEISVLAESLRKLKEIGLRQESDIASPLTELVHRNRN